MRPRNHWPRTNTSRSRSQRMTSTYFDGPRRKITATGAAAARTSARRGGGGMVKPRAASHRLDHLPGVEVLPEACDLAIAQRPDVSEGSAHRPPRRAIVATVTPESDDVL